MVAPAQVEALPVLPLVDCAHGELRTAFGRPHGPAGRSRWSIPGRGGRCCGRRASPPLGLPLLQVCRVRQGGRSHQISMGLRRRDGDCEVHRALRARELQRRLAEAARDKVGGGCVRAGALWSACRSGLLATLTVSRGGRSVDFGALDLLGGVRRAMQGASLLCGDEPVVSAGARRFVGPGVIAAPCRPLGGVVRAWRRRGEGRLGGGGPSGPAASAPGRGRAVGTGVPPQSGV